tara:strand:+ start:11277 stop:11672 length:396 start_codon:yes stop_codon:yes gene_type:complete
MAKSNNPVKRFVSMEYNFDDDGGATPIVPKRTSNIPGGAIITDFVLHCKKSTAATGSATIKVQAGGRDLTTALGKATVVKNYITNNAFAGGVSFVKAAEAGGEIKLVIASGPLTAGIIEVTIGYLDAEHIA